MSSYSLGPLRVVDLTKPLDPATETRRCHLLRFNTGGPIPDYHTVMDLTSHLGTHCECPYHHSDDWPDVAALPLNRFMGRGIYVTLRDVEPNSYITAAVLDRALGEKIRTGDIVILDSPHTLHRKDQHRGGPAALCKWRDRPLDGRSPGLLRRLRGRCFH